MPSNKRPESPNAETKEAKKVKLESDSTPLLSLPQSTAATPQSSTIVTPSPAPTTEKKSKSASSKGKQQNAATSANAPGNKAPGSTAKEDDQLTDAVAAAGVNIEAEEKALVSGLSASKRQIEPNNFLKTHQLAWFVKKSMDDMGLDMEIDNDVLSTMSSACETYMASIITDSLVLSRHRRKPVVTKTKPATSAATRSDVSRALRDIATRQKEKEEKRLKRRILLGLDTEEKEKTDATTDEHRATNATAAMMMSGSKQKKYSWMLSGSAPGGGGRANSIQARGDTGIRYREARQEPGIVPRDLLAAIENRRVGVTNTLVKGYSKLRD
ncbi:hypothetical protein B5S33_g1542 [[Candida] boidinii]|nr:hypothetical protein B5S33_g1542 [[Candida] boidinii]